MIKSLKAQGNSTVKVENQLKILSETNHIPSFSKKLNEIGLYPLSPKKLEILQVNIGYMCNQVCEHCHVDAGPDRKEIMTTKTMLDCLNAIDKSEIKVVDITGGAPEMHPDFCWFIEELHKRKVEIIVRSNLTIIVSNKKYDSFPEFFKKNNVKIIASLPCYTAENTDKQRGSGVFESSIKAMKLLNEVGYGKENTDLELNLVYNPGGPSISPNQKALEKDYKTQLKTNFGIEFNQLYTITNLPISRFLDYLLIIGKYDEYMTKLVNSFNAKAAQNVMCRNTISVGYDGTLYDCDFNQMLGLQLTGKISNISSFDKNQIKERSIVLNNHCYGCTAGDGSSCQGALV